MDRKRIRLIALLVLVVLLFASALVPAASAARKKPPKKTNAKVAVCHVTGNGSYRKIVVSENAVPAHLAHGDVLVADAAGSGLDQNCKPLPDLCPDDPDKTEPGVCGCGVADTDTDGDGTPDCNDGCPEDPAKTEPGACGCGVPDTDSDGDGTPDCQETPPAE